GCDGGRMENGIAVVLPLAESNPMPTVPVTTPRPAETFCSTRVLRLITAMGDLRQLRIGGYACVKGSACDTQPPAAQCILSYLTRHRIINCTPDDPCTTGLARQSEPKCPRILQTSAAKKGSGIFSEFRIPALARLANEFLRVVFLDPAGPRKANRDAQERAEERRPTDSGLDRIFVSQKTGQQAKHGADDCPTCGLYDRRKNQMGSVACFCDSHS